jgi:hypothetical protein
MRLSIRQCRGRQAKAELAASKADRPPQRRRGARPKLKYRKQPHAKKHGAAGWDVFDLPFKKHFDTSGKSPAQLHHPASCKSAHGPPPAAGSTRLQLKHPQPLKLHRVRHSE